MLNDKNVDFKNVVKTKQNKTKQNKNNKKKKTSGLDIHNLQELKVFSEAVEQ